MQTIPFNKPFLNGNEIKYIQNVFDKNKLWDICDKGVTKDTILALTKRINGGTHGLAEREEKTFKYYTYVK